MKRSKTVPTVGGVCGLLALGALLVLLPGGGRATDPLRGAGHVGSVPVGAEARGAERAGREVTRVGVESRQQVGQPFRYEARMIQRAEGAEIAATRQRISGVMLSRENAAERVIMLWLRDPQVVMSHGGRADRDGARSLEAALSAGLEFQLNETGRVTAYRSSRPLDPQSAVLVREVARSVLHEPPDASSGALGWAESYPYRYARWSAGRMSGADGVEHFVLHRERLRLIDREGRRMAPSRQSGREQRARAVGRSLPVSWTLQTEMSFDLGFGSLEARIVGSMEPPRPVPAVATPPSPGGSWIDLDGLSVEVPPEGPVGDIAEVARAVQLAEGREQRILVARDLLRRLRRDPDAALDLRALVLDPSLEVEVFDLLLEVLARVGGEHASEVLAAALVRPGLEPLRRQLLLKNLSVCEDARDVLVHAVHSQLTAGDVQAESGMALLALGSLARSNELGGQLLEAARPGDADPALMTWVLARANGSPEAASEAGRSVIDHRDPGVREAAVEALVTGGSPADLDLLRQVAAGDPEPGVRGLAIRSLASALDDGAIEPWATEVIATQDAAMRGQLAKGLQERPASPVVERLLDRLRLDPSRAVRDLIG